MPTVAVAMLAFHTDHPSDITYRNVMLPEGETPTLDRVYELGQNEFQPVAGRCSVSVGDVILLDGFHLVVAVGFKKISKERFYEIVNTPRHDRWKFGYEDAA